MNRGGRALPQRAGIDAASELAAQCRATFPVLLDLRNPDSNETVATSYFACTILLPQGLSQCLGTTLLEDGSGSIQAAGLGVPQVGTLTNFAVTGGRRKDQGRLQARGAGPDL